MNVNFLDLQKQYRDIKPEINRAIEKVFESAAFVSGPFVKSFEQNFARAHQSSFCCCVNSGTSALHIALWALGIKPGDEVIVPVNTFFATAEAVSLTGAVPVFIDCEEKYHNIDTSKIESAITDKTKVIIAVHLYGQPAEMKVLQAIAKKHKLLLVEDCAQAHLSAYEGRFVGTFGVCGCFSFYPGKNLGAYGEGGAVVTNDKKLYETMSAIRNHGSVKKYHHDRIGHNYRMEGIQGAVLDTKLKHLSSWTSKRRANAELYKKYLSDVPQIILPEEADNRIHVYHLFVILAKNRDELAEFLKQNQIYTGIHYPIPCHLQKAYWHLNYKEGDFPVAEKYADEILSLPMHESLTEQEIIYVADKIREFYSD